MTARVTTHKIDSSDAHPIVADVYRPDDRDEVGRAVILCHGFKGHRRWGFIPRLARRIRDAGIAAVSMDFSLNGHPPEGGPSFPFPDRFRTNTIARECDDLCRVIEWVRAGAGDSVAPGLALGLWGHSRGGVAVILYALDDPTIPAIVTWAAAARPDFYTAHQKASWRERGCYEFTDAETGTPLAIGVEYLDDLERHAEEYALGERAPQLAVAHLIVHGEQDMVIPVADAALLAKGPGDRAEAFPEKELLAVRAGHTFGYGEGAPSQAYARAAEATVAWFDRHLPKGAIE
jgi:dienelactone hydrolase